MKRQTFVSPAEERLLKTAVEWFANLKRWPKTTRPIERRFARDMAAAGYIAAPKDFKTMKSEGEIAQLRGDCEEFVIWLGFVRAGKGAEIVDEVNEKLKEKTRMRVQASRHGLRFGPEVNGVEAVCLYAISLLLDDSRGAAERLRRCGAPGCGKFILDLSPSGRPRRSCEGHRLRAWREEQRRKRDGNRQTT